APVMIITLMDWADVNTALTFEATGIGSDQLGVTSAEARVHPRCYGTFARILGRIVRERGVLSPEAAIHKMTGLPASHLGLADAEVGTPEVADRAGVVRKDPHVVRDGQRRVRRDPEDAVLL